MVKEIKETEFKEKTKEGKVLVDCYANWCGPCKMLSPVIDEVSEEVDDILFYKLNVDDADEVSNEYNIMTIPTLLLFNDGKLIKQVSGFMSKDEILEFINND